MVNTDETQVAPESRSLARKHCSNKRSEFFYNLRRLAMSQSQGESGRRGQKGGERGLSARGGLGRPPVGSPGPILSASDFGQKSGRVPGSNGAEPGRARSTRSGSLSTTMTYHREGYTCASFIKLE